jgi:hypothetical protein
MHNSSGFKKRSVNYCRLVAVSVDKPKVCGAATAWRVVPSSATKREAIDLLSIRDETEAEYPGCAILTTFVTAPDLFPPPRSRWLVFRRQPMLELRRDMRAVMSQLSTTPTRPTTPVCQDAGAHRRG